MKRFLTGVLLAPIRAYQRWISPAFPRRCRYEPTCSAYASEAIRELGPARGLVLAGWRLLRCNPFSRGGIDDVADRTLFRGEEHGSPSDGVTGARSAPVAAASSRSKRSGLVTPDGDPPPPPQRTAGVST